MYAFHVATLVLAASAVAPVLSAPLVTSDVVSRDPELSVNNIRDLLDRLDIRSEDVIAALFKRDGDIADSILPRSRIVKLLGRDDDDDSHRGARGYGPVNTNSKRFPSAASLT